MNNKPNQTEDTNLYYKYEEVKKVNKPEIPKMLSAKEVASILQIGYVKTLEMMRYGKIPAIRLGNTYRTSEEALANWLNSNLKA